MSDDPFTGEIMLYGFNFAPVDWAMCHGQSIAISQNPTLYSLIGTRFGGNQVTFNYPDFRGRTPYGIDYTPPDPVPGQILNGTVYGYENIYLLASNTPHTHDLLGWSPNTTARGFPTNPTGSQRNALSDSANSPGTDIYTNSAPGSQAQEVGAGWIQFIGGNLSHTNMQPFTALNFCICLDGTYPPRN